MKQVKDLKKGDVIYYWDHGKMHPQVLTADIEVITEKHSYKDWAGYFVSYDIKKYIIHRERGGDLTLGEYYGTASQFTANNMLRFTCKESAIHWLNIREQHLERKVNKLEKRVASMHKNITNINNSIQSICCYKKSL